MDLDTLCTKQQISFYSHIEPDIRFNVYGDPQIEGDAKIQREPTTGKYDLLINDYYLHHVYKSTITAFKPHYVVTMGDIFSSQWVKHEEYYKRIERFKWISHRIDNQNRTINSSHKYIFMAGNHDIGYGEETRAYHINRFVKNFGTLNRKWSLNINGREHRIAILNAMNLDKSRIEQYRIDAWDFVRELAADHIRHPDVPLILFLHIPLYKPNGVCISSSKTIYRDGFVRYQDYLSPETSAYLLHCLAPTLVFNGHDHDGCTAVHTVSPNASIPVALDTSSNRQLVSASDLCSLTLAELDAYQPQVEAFALGTMISVASTNATNTNSSWSTIEITVRSAMGEYGGVTGIFDISSDSSSQVSAAHAGLHAFGRNVKVTANGHIYQYREVPFGYHIVIRALVITNIVSCIVIPALLLLCS
ncbi:hypothetical protein BX070DRAFT_236531 [Coemansia spiralis]|nr:hypothetical protein BX070DRAFT_236531 [Coemansia spiralis]